MSAALLDEAPAAVPPLRCPSCDKPLTHDLACWHCCDRLCRRCRQQTGTAFISICWACWFQESGEINFPENA
jgi:hypothetical protein